MMRFFSAELSKIAGVRARGVEALLGAAPGAALGAALAHHKGQGFGEEERAGATAGAALGAAASLGSSAMLRSTYLRRAVKQFQSTPKMQDMADKFIEGGTLKTKLEALRAELKVVNDEATQQRTFAEVVRSSGLTPAKVKNIQRFLPGHVDDLSRQLGTSKLQEREYSEVAQNAFGAGHTQTGHDYRGYAAQERAWGQHLSERLRRAASRIQRARDVEHAASNEVRNRIFSVKNSTVNVESEIEKAQKEYNKELTTNRKGLRTEINNRIFGKF